MEKIILTKSSINRALAMLRRLKKKMLPQQVDYLAIHRIRRDPRSKEFDLLKKVQRKKSDPILLYETLAYKNAQWFWSDQKHQTFISYKPRLESYRKMVCNKDYRSIEDDPEISVTIPQDLFVILEWLQLVR
ncbi:MAG: hypothetical protein WCJ45_00120 [bacterium]